MREQNKVEQFENVRLGDKHDSLIILDQTKLPNEEVYLNIRTEDEMYEAIHQLKVRGAPAIGIFAAYSIYCLARGFAHLEMADFVAAFKKSSDHLNASRPTAVNLSWALNRMEQVVNDHQSEAMALVIEALKNEATSIHQEDIEMCYAIASHGLKLINDGDGILTHCNAGPIATSKYGTALGPLLLGRERGMEFKVFADETRPLLQGARLTATELYKAGIDVTLICDNMASIVMSQGKIQACFVGCDRVAANGDTANKIGTSGVAILAKHYKIPFYVLGPTSTIDLNSLTGDDIVIEERNPKEIKEKFYQKPMALAEVKCYNPAFDVTSHELITGIVTEKGICYPPYKESIARLFE